MAYRGLGDTAKAEEHLKLWKNTEVLVPDPFRRELDLALESGLSYELRGVRALEQRDFKAAADFFKKGVDITPAASALGRSLRHKLATALYLQGDVRGAMKWFEETLRMAPDNGIDETAAKAHYSLGVLMASSGRSQEAISHLSAASRFSPNYVEAYQALGDALRRSGRVEQSLAQYAEALRINPEVRRRAIWLRHGAGADWDDIARRATGSTRPRASIPTARIFRSRWPACSPPHPTTAFAMGSERRPSSSSLLQAEQDDRPWRDDGHGAGRTGSVRGGGRDPASDDGCVDPLRARLRSRDAWRRICCATSAASRAACRGPTTTRSIRRDRRSEPGLLTSAPRVGGSLSGLATAALARNQTLLAAE